MSFLNISRQVAESFLQTVIVIDDEAHLRGCPEEITKLNEEITRLKMELDLAKFCEQNSPEALNEPGRITQEQPAEKVETQIQSEEEVKDHKLDAKLMGDIFAEKGLVCSVLKPEIGDDRPLNESIQAIKRSDVLILDWILNRDNGSKIQSLISEIITSDKENGGRLRLILIYTGETDLNGVQEKIEEKIRTDHPEIILNENIDFTLKYDSLKISIYAKEQSATPHTMRKIPIRLLPQCVIEEFISLTNGIIPNITLDSLSAIRNNTHILLNKFNADLDAPFLAHRSLLENPYEASEHLTSILSEELNAIMNDYETAERHLSPENIISWANDRKVIEENLILPLQEPEKFQALITLGLTNSDVKRIHDKLKGYTNNNFAEVTKLFTADLEAHKKIETTKQNLARAKQLRTSADNLVKKESSSENNMSYTLANKECSTLQNELDALESEYKRESLMIEQKDHRFATLMSMMSRYINPVVHMRLGVVIKNVIDNQYYICMQPRCDSVRIYSEIRSFPFLPLKLLTKEERGEGFDLTIFFELEYLYFKIMLEPYETKLLEFKPDETIKKIMPILNNDRKFEFTCKGTQKYIFCGELKPLFAQDIATLYASKLSRVGLNKSEWHRRWNEKLNG